MSAGCCGGRGRRQARPGALPRGYAGYNVAGVLYLVAVFVVWYVLGGLVAVLELLGVLAVVGTIVIGFCRNVTRQSHSAVFEQMHAERRELERRQLRAIEAPRTRQIEAPPLEQAGRVR